MNNTTINDKTNMTYEHYNKQPMQSNELKLNMIIAKNPHVKISFIIFINHPLIRKYSHISFNK